MAADPLDKLEPRADVDRALLAALARDGRASYTELATQVGLSVSAVHQRVRRLEQRGVITGYAARVDATAVGLPMVAFVSITPIDVAQPDDAPARLAHLTAIEACHSVAGPDSYMLKVRVGLARRPGGPARRDPGRGQRHHPHDGRAHHLLRGPAAGLSPLDVAGDPLSDTTVLHPLALDGGAVRRLDVGEPPP